MALNTGASLAAPHIRTALREAFPQVAFRVTTGHGVVRVIWTNGPHKDAVEQTLRPWEPGSIGGAAHMEYAMLNISRPNHLHIERNVEIGR